MYGCCQTGEPFLEGCNTWLRCNVQKLMPTCVCAGRVCYWDLVEETMLESFQAHKSYVCSLAMHPDGTLLLTSSTDGTVKVWQ